MPFPQPDPDLALELITGRADAAPLFAEAQRLRDEGKGRDVTYSRKVFVPVTTLCRDTCTYCTFAKPPGAGGEYLTPEDVMANTGSRYGPTDTLAGLEHALGRQEPFAVICKPCDAGALRMRAQREWPTERR